MYGAACRAQLNVPFMCTATTASKSSSLIFTSERSRTMPALLTRMSILPNSFTAVSMIRCAPSKSLTES